MLEKLKSWWNYIYLLVFHINSLHNCSCCYLLLPYFLYSKSIRLCSCLAILLESYYCYNSGYMSDSSSLSHYFSNRRHYKYILCNYIHTIIRLFCCTHYLLCNDCSIMYHLSKPLFLLWDNDNYILCCWMCVC